MDKRELTPRELNKRLAEFEKRIAKESQDREARELEKELQRIFK